MKDRDDWKINNFDTKSCFASLPLLLFNSIENLFNWITWIIVKTLVSLPTGHQLTVFNSQSVIQVGGKWNKSKGKIEKPFLGVIAGLVVNGARILELTAAKDGRVTTRGDVQLLPAGSLIDRAAPLQRMQQVWIKLITLYNFSSDLS